MKTINLTKGFVAIVDDEDFEELNKYKWRVTFNGQKYYASRVPSRKLGKRRQILMHRQISKPTERQDVDHINGDTLDNRKQNLRNCSHSDNQKNSKRRIDNTSGFKGVSKAGARWRARICVNGKQLELGKFSTPESAAKAYEEAADLYFGEFKNLGK